MDRRSVIAASLHSLFRLSPTSSSSSTEQRIGAEELHRRAFVATRVMRHAAERVATINKLAKFLMTLYVIDLVNRKEPIPALLSDKNHTVWNWSILLTSRLKGERVVPQLKQKEVERTTIYRHMKRVFDEQLKPCLPADFVLPDRDGLTEILPYECALRVVDFKTLIATNLYRRQGKVVRHQVQRLDAFQRVASSLPTDEATALRYACTRRVVAHVNRWSDEYLQDADTKLEDALEDALKKAAKKASKKASKKARKAPQPPAPAPDSPPPPPPSSLSSPLIAALDAIVREHQAGFGNSPLTDHATYRLSEDDCQISGHASHYVHYFSYLHARYEEFRALRALAKQRGDSTPAAAAATATTSIAAAAPAPASIAAAPTSTDSPPTPTPPDAPPDKGPKPLRAKWHAFPIIPQLRLAVPFIELHAKGVHGLIALSRTSGFDEYLKESFKDYQPETGHLPDGCSAEQFKALVLGQPTVDWLVDDNKSITRDWASKEENQQKLFDLLLSGPVAIKRLLGTAKAGERWRFACLLSTDGQQVKVHYEQLSLDPQHAGAGSAGSSPSSSPSPSPSSPSSSSACPPSTPPTVEPISREEFDRWIAEHKTIISVDPGHRDLITAVRHHPPSRLSGPPPPPQAVVVVEVKRQERQREWERKRLHRPARPRSAGSGPQPPQPPHPLNPLRPLRPLNPLRPLTSLSNPLHPLSHHNP